MRMRKLAAQADHTSDLPIPRKPQRRLVQGFIDLDLFEAVSAHCQQQDPPVEIREVLEWGYACYLLRVDPKAAAQLGIKK